MNSKKLISLLSAAAVASTMIAVPMSASAENMYSADFEDGSTTGWSLANGTVSIQEDENGKYIQLQGANSGNRVGGFALPTTLSGNNTIEFDTMMTRGNGMGRIMHETQIAFTNDTSTMDTRDGANITEEVNAAQNTNYNSGYGSSVANAALKINLRPYLANKWVINEDVADTLVAYPDEAVDVTDQTWVRVQAVIDGSTTKVTVIDGTGAKLVDGVTYANTSDAMTNIYVVSNRGDGGSGIVALDNIRIYDGEPEELTTTGLRGQAAVATKKPAYEEPETKDAAPDLVPPSSATVSIDQLDFSTELDRVTLGDSGNDITALEGLNIHIGGRSGGAATTYVETSEYAEGDKVLKLAGGQYSNAGRGPVVSAVTPLSHDETTASVMTFAVNLTSESTGGEGRLYILGTTRQAGQDGSGAYNAVMYTLSTDDTCDYQVDPYTWYKVAVITSNDGYRVWVAKADEAFAKSPNLKADHVGQGESSIGMDQLGLPYLAVTSAAGNGNPTNSIARIDNLSTYTGTPGDEGPRTLLPSSAAGVATPAPPATPEPASSVEGSFIDLKPESATIDFTENAKAVQGTALKMLNHSEAKPAVAGTFSVYEDKNIRGKSVYAAYDVFVSEGDKLSVIAKNNTSIGTTFVIEAGENGTASVYANVNKGDKVNVGTIANETWYRVVIEIPQLNNEGVTNTGDAAYTIYRIDPENPAQTKEIVAQKTGLTPRNLSDRGCTTLEVAVTGSPYIDNVTAYVDSASEELAADTYRVFTVNYTAEGKLDSVTSEVVEDITGITPVLDGNAKKFVWKTNSPSGMEPIVIED